MEIVAGVFEIVLYIGAIFLLALGVTLFFMPFIEMGDDRCRDRDSDLTMTQKIVGSLVSMFIGFWVFVLGIHCFKWLA